MFVCFGTSFNISYHAFFFIMLLLLQGCSSPLVVKFADTQRDKEQRRLQQQLVQQIQQLNNASTWGNLAGLGTLTPQYLAVSAFTLGRDLTTTNIHTP